MPLPSLMRIRQTINMMRRNFRVIIKRRPITNLNLPTLSRSTKLLNRSTPSNPMSLFNFTNRQLSLQPYINPNRIIIRVSLRHRRVKGISQNRLSTILLSNRFSTTLRMILLYTLNRTLSRSNLILTKGRISTSHFARNILSLLTRFVSIATNVSNMFSLFLTSR